MTSSRASADDCWLAASMVSCGVLAPISRERESAIVLENRLLVARVALHRFHEVRNHIVAALQLVLHLGPLGLDRLFLRRELVVGASREPDGHHDDHRRVDRFHKSLSHLVNLWCTCRSLVTSLESLITNRRS